MEQIDELKSPAPVIWLDLKACGVASGEIIDISIQPVADSNQTELVILLGTKVMRYPGDRYRSVLFENGHHLKIYVRTRLLKIGLHKICYSNLFLNGFRCLHSVELYKCKNLRVHGHLFGQTPPDFILYYAEQCEYLTVNDEGECVCVIYSSCSVTLNSKKVINILPESFLVKSGTDGLICSTIPFPSWNHKQEGDRSPVAYLVKPPQDKAEEIQLGKAFSW